MILHFYNSTSTLQRKVVFHMEMDGIIKNRHGCRQIDPELSEPVIAKGMNLRYEYSPESFSGTEMDNAALICQKVIETIGATPENKIILNLPATVEGSMPNQYADQIEYFIRHLPPGTALSSPSIPTTTGHWRGHYRNGSSGRR